MASTMVSAGNPPRPATSGAKARIWASIGRLNDWLEKNDYRGYDTFDGLSAKFLRPFTFETKYLRIVLQQTVRRFPVNLRPVLGIPRSRSTKGMGYLARGYMRLQDATGDKSWGERAESALQWLIENESKGAYSGACWGNHFDYQSRGFYLPKGVPTIVWTSLIGHAFLDGYDHFGNEKYLQVAASACEHISHDLERLSEGEDAFCFSYIPIGINYIHNANTLGGSLLARVFSHTRNEAYLSLAQKALQYTANHQRADASWYYGEGSEVHWVDNFHTAYVLDCFKYYIMATGDDRFQEKLDAGYQYWKNTFFLPNGTPRYYDRKTLPIDIQCSSQAIDTLVFFRDQDPDSVSLALNVANWTIDNMQDPSGYFYYRRYSPIIVNKTPTLHWGQATMLSALSSLYKVL
jgi:polysaccharide biosynthesis protein VpsJ